MSVNLKWAAGCRSSANLGVLLWSVVWIFVWLACCSTNAHAVSISEDRVDDLIILKLNGEITAGDGEKFAAAATNYFGSNVVVILSGPGGNLFAGLSIGETIKSRGWGTFVVSHSECASVCGLIWVAGSPRFIGETGKVGFHAAFTTQSGEARETGAGNAMVGAYLTKLGLPYSAVLYMTSSPPEEMRWLNDADATKMGIKLAIIPDRSAKVALPATSAVSRDRPAGNTIEQRAMQFMVDYYSLWSGSAPTALIAQTYADTVEFYGKNTPRDQLMAVKIQFSNRWPSRIFKIQEGSLHAQCDAGDCLVSGIVGWDTNSPARNARSVGSANFAFKLRVGQDNRSANSPLIWYENGSVIARQTSSLDSPNIPSQPIGGAPTGGALTASSAQIDPTSYARGLADRRAYEGWFAALSDEGRQGAAFWAANRSRVAKGQRVSCNPTGMTALWISGCTEAKGMLANSDQRRLSDVDYRAGWNSIP